MEHKSITGPVKTYLPFIGWRMSTPSSSGRRILVGAALLHIVLSAGLFLAGRMQLAPGLIDRDGIMGSFAYDSYKYQSGAAQLADFLRQGHIGAWVSEPLPVHVKLISLQFVFLGPLFGDSTLSAEPLNLFSYLAVVGLTLILGREVGGNRAGNFAAVVVALWPTFLLHTIQLLKDSLFIAMTLALVLCVTTWLTRDYEPWTALTACALAVGASSVLLLIRVNFVVIVFALVLFGFVLLVIRQIGERRLMWWNMVCPLLVLSVGVLLFLSFHPGRVIEKLKHYPSDGGGPPKTMTTDGEQLPAVVTYRRRVYRKQETPHALHSLLDAEADKAALKISTIRERFSAFYAEAGSNIDSEVTFNNFSDLFFYLPRGIEIGCFAPFPSMWIGSGGRVGEAGRLLSGAETLVIYVFELLALIAVLRPPRRLAAWLLFLIILFGVTLLGLTVPNIGALYRFRYTFWVLLIILGAKGFDLILLSFRQAKTLPGPLPGFSRRADDWLKRIGTISDSRRITLRKVRLQSLIVRAVTYGSSTCFLAVALSCSSQSGPASNEPEQQLRALTLQTTTPALPGGPVLELANYTGATLKAVYISPSDSPGWEENIIEKDELVEEGSVRIRFSPEEKSATWDLKVEDAGKHFAEWKSVTLRDVSRITLRLNLSGKKVAVAQLE